MIKSFKTRISVDPRGTITSGKKDSKGLPVKLDYFNVEDFRELVEAYGAKPTEVVVVFPTDNIPDFFDNGLALWKATKAEGKGIKIRSCDEEECIHCVPETIGGKKYEAGEISPCVCDDLPEDDPQRCHFRMKLKAWIALPKSGKVENLMCYAFSTGSRNSSDAIYSELLKVQWFNKGTLRGVPFVLSVKMVTSSTDNKIRFPIWSIRSAVTVTEMQRLTGTSLEEGPKQLPAAEVPAKVPDPVARGKASYSELLSDLDTLEVGGATSVQLGEWAAKRKEDILALTADEKTKLNETYKGINHMAIVRENEAAKQKKKDDLPF